MHENDVPSYIPLSQCSIGDFVFSETLGNAYLIVPLGGVLPHSLTPEVGIPLCYWASREYPEKAVHTMGDFLVDLPKETIVYGTFERSFLEGVLRALERGWTLDERVIARFQTPQWRTYEHLLLEKYP